MISKMATCRLVDVIPLTQYGYRLVNFVQCAIANTQYILNFAERMRLSPGPAGRPGIDCPLLGLRPSLVRGRHCLVHQPRQVPHQGVGVLSSGRKATVLGNQVC